MTLPSELLEPRAVVNFRSTLSCLVLFSHSWFSSALTYEQQPPLLVYVDWCCSLKLEGKTLLFFEVLKIKVENLLNFNENFNSLKQLMPSAVFDDIVRVSHGGLSDFFFCFLESYSVKRYSEEEKKYWKKNHLKKYWKRSWEEEKKKVVELDEILSQFWTLNWNAFAFFGYPISDQCCLQFGEFWIENKKNCVFIRVWFCKEKLIGKYLWISCVHEFQAKVWWTKFRIKVHISNEIWKWKINWIHKLCNNSIIILCFRFYFCFSRSTLVEFEVCEHYKIHKIIVQNSFFLMSTTRGRFFSVFSSCHIIFFLRSSSPHSKRPSLSGAMPSCAAS